MSFTFIDNYLSTNYVLANIFSSIILLIILLANRNVDDFSRARQYFTWGTLALIAYFLCDSYWMMMKTEVVKFHWLRAVWINAFLAWILNLVSVLFFSYILHRRRHRCILRIHFLWRNLPAILDSGAVLLLAMFWPESLLTKHGQVTWLCDVTFLSIPVLYSLLVVLLSLRKFFEQRGEKFFLTLGGYPLVMIFSGLIQIQGWEIPLFCLSVTAYVVYSYTSLTINKISLDNLTGLHHRQYVQSQAQKLLNQGTRDYHLLMVDVNNLKQVNDIHGHLRGDEVLKIVGQALQNLTIKRKLLACRYGGDEFLVLLHSKKIQTLEKVKHELRQEIRKIAAEMQADTLPQVAIGSSQLGESLKSSIKEADQKLYADKRHLKSNSRQLDLFIDRVTGLRNANYLNNQQFIQTEKRQATVIFWDISNLQGFNKQYGYDRGNGILKKAAEAIKVEFLDELTVRYTEDKFVTITFKPGVADKVQRVCKNFNTLIKNRTVNLRVGSYQWQQKQETVIMAVDKARQAKNYLGQNRQENYIAYNHEVEEYYANKEYILTHFNIAIQRGWIKPYFQVQIRSLTGNYAGMEALARWEDPQKGIISPNVFIPILEEAHLVEFLDLYMLEQICQAIVSGEKYGLPIVPISFNLSPLDLEGGKIVNKVEKVRQKYQVDPHYIKIEILESAMTQNEADFRKAITEFQQLGYEVWLDDFGSGYSSLNNLQNYKFNMVKLDRFFLQKSETTPQAKVLITQVVSLIKQLGMHVLCEGVETEAQVEFLKQIGCERLQGYYYSKPMPYEKAWNFLKKSEFKYYESYEEGVYYDKISQIDILSDPFNENSDFDGRYPLGIVQRDAQNKLSIYLLNRRYQEVMEYYNYDNQKLEETLAKDKSLHAEVIKILTQSEHSKTAIAAHLNFHGHDFVLRAKPLAHYQSKVTYVYMLGSLENLMR
ncbi:hypothetical protein FC36_GL000750 [Ligilactobacillus equi DSM 15833 = JCM 10991]|nr:EAL domain-containing protein [Ligilactobacillus equi]KRL83182.1 hypothetical protein FC36_GL000750 [Ligilactobacillus equi DSM 15833 = JCM 10991]